jgi:MFS family permease
MNKRVLWSRILCLAGIVVIVLGVAVFRPGSELRRQYMHVLCTLSGSCLAALGAFLGKSRYRRFLYVALGVTVCGLILPFLLWAIHSDYGPWWAFAEYVYPIAGIMSLVGAVLILIEPLCASIEAALERVPLSTRTRRSRILDIVGLAVMVVGAIALLGGVVAFSLFGTVLALASFFLPGLGSGLVALGALLGKSRYRTFMCCAFLLTLWGTIGAFDLVGNFEAAAVGWRAYAAPAYLIGVIVSCVGAVLVIVDSFGGPPVPKDDIERNTNYLSS